MIWLFALLFGMQVAAGPSGAAPDTLTLAESHLLVEERFPTADKEELQRRMTEINRRMAASGAFPQVQAGAMASYQSDVTEVTFTPPGAEPPTFSRDHYRLSLELAQPIYAGGRISALQAVEEASGRRGAASVRVELQQVREQVSRVYFNALMLQKEAESVRLLAGDLRQQLRTVRARVRQGVLLASQQYILEAELVRARQDSIRAASRLHGAREMLGELLGRELGTGTALSVPPTEMSRAGLQDELRPEFGLYDASMALLDRRAELAGSRRTPSLSAFATTAWGRPGLDAFDDDLQAWYVVGVRLRWNLWQAVNAGRERQVLNLQRQQAEADERAFERRLGGELATLRREILSLEEVVASDEKLIRLSRQIVEEHASRLEQGAITATEYLSALNRLNRAELNRQVHRVELARAVSDYNTKLGAKP
ncbi:MAG: TolC family protein [Balneolaceae bacterium]|nr:TolC family protein [Balneolaceae bacterium]